MIKKFNILNRISDLKIKVKKLNKDSAEWENYHDSPSGHGINPFVQKIKNIKIQIKTLKSL